MYRSSSGSGHKFRLLAAPAPQHRLGVNTLLLLSWGRNHKSKRNEQEKNEIFWDKKRRVNDLRKSAEQGTTVWEITKGGHVTSPGGGGIFS
jgi:hypothetical protein